MIARIAPVREVTVFVLGSSFLLSCAPDWDGFVRQAREAKPAVFVPGRVNGKVSRGVRIYLTAEEQPRLFRAELSSRQVTSIRRGDVSKALQTEEWPLWDLSSHGDAGGLGTATVLGSLLDAGAVLGRHAWSPTALLDADTMYTLVTDVQHVSFGTLSKDEPVLERVWPTGGQTAEVALFCAPSGLSSGAPPGSPASLWATEHVLFGENLLDAQWRGLGGERPCWLWSPALSMPAVTPPRLGSFAVEPTLMGGSNVGSPPEARDCADGETRAGLGCATVLDERILVRTPETESLWLITPYADDSKRGGSGDILDDDDSGSGFGEAALGNECSDASWADAALGQGNCEGGPDNGGGWFVARPSAVGVVKGLTPDTDYQLRLLAFYPGASSQIGELWIRTTPRMHHVVINEVMADPVGAEPDQEWVELYNDGPTAVDLHGWTLADNGQGVVLPAYEIAPSGYLLLVNDTYVRQPEIDVVPDADAPLLRLPILGTSGLSNSGETLRLTDQSRIVVSSFPGIPKPTSGVSVARRAPWLSGADVHAFALHELPGASPGAPNRTSR